MKSIFDLKTQNKDLSSSNQGLSNYKYIEVQPLRSVVGNNFINGELIFRWTYGSNKFWIPNKSYIRIRLNLTGTALALLRTTSNLALSMNTAPQMFQSMSYKISDQTVCSITENLTQIDTLKNRQSKSGAWLNTIGQSLNNWHASFEDREQKLMTLGGHHLNPNQCYYTWPNVITLAKIANNDQIALSRSGVIYTFTFTDTANSDLDLRLLVNVKIGDMIVFQLFEQAVGVTGSPINGQIYGSGIVTSLPTQTSISFASLTETLEEFAATTINVDSPYTISFARHSIFGDQNSTFSENIDLIWTPTLPIFDSVKHAIPCAGTKQELVLTPFNDTQWQKNIIESRVANLVPGTNYSVSVTDMRFYILTCDSNKIDDNFSFMLDLNEIQCQPIPITNVTQQTTVDVSASTNGITIAFQDEDVLTSTLYPLSKFTTRNNLQNGLTRYYIRYEGQVPTPDFEGSIDSIGKKDLMIDVYNRTKIYDGSIYHDSVETLEEYRNRGMYIYHPFPKTASSRNTVVVIQTNFELLGSANPFLLVFSHSKKAVVLKVMNGKIVEVSPYDV